MQKEKFGEFTYARSIPEYRCDGDTSGNSAAAGTTYTSCLHSPEMFQCTSWDLKIHLTLILNIFHMEKSFYKLGDLSKTKTPLFTFISNIFIY